jgi:TolA-binding protein
LLTSAESEELTSLNGEISSLEQLLKSQEKQLQTVEQALEESEGTMVLVEGAKKLVVLNKIEYLKHMNYHPTGLVLHPETIKVIENVHYLVNNNLPVSKFVKNSPLRNCFKSCLNCSRRR